MGRVRRPPPVPLPIPGPGIALGRRGGKTFAAARAFRERVGLPLEAAPRRRFPSPEAWLAIVLVVVLFLVAWRLS